ncbi:MAG: fructose-bisphosphatase class I [Betaproteobacteria bacterium TMED41]|nr:MAG: fructose-bisphosphatase class I [Betaproteobacteria bacterium TMED41]
METEKIDLSNFLLKNSTSYEDPKSFVELMMGIIDASNLISTLISNGEIGGVLGNLPTTNIQGETQKKLDVLSNDIFIEALLKNNLVSCLISEENENPITNEYNPSGPYTVFFDPLDGSSNIDVNVSVGSIFSIFKYKKNSDSNDIVTLDPGREQIAAGYALYGPSTMFVLSTGKGTHGFTFNSDSKKFILTHPNITVPIETHEFSINTSNERFWNPPISRYIKECNDGEIGERDKNFNMRWTGSMVADVHRILMRGGIFMYPKDSKVPEKAGRLRLMYEANPMAFLMEQARGAASTGREKLLDIIPECFHQRISVIMGSKEEVDRVIRYYAEHDDGKDFEYKSPLFKERSLFQKSD